MSTNPSSNPTLSAVPSTGPSSSPSDRPSESPSESASSAPSEIPSFESISHEVCKNFAVHGGTTVTFDGVMSTIHHGDVGVSPGISITGDFRLITRGMLLVFLRLMLGKLIIFLLNSPLLCCPPMVMQWQTMAMLRRPWISGSEA